METEFVWEEHCLTLIDMQKNILKNEIFPDVKLICHDKEILLAHKFVLARNSAFLENCFKNIPLTSDALNVIILPDITKCLMKKILQFLYCGEVHLDSDKIGEFFEIKSFLGIKSDSFEYYIQKQQGSILNFEICDEYIKNNNDLHNEKISNENNISELKEQQTEIFQLKTKGTDYMFLKVGSTEFEDESTISNYNLEINDFYEKDSIDEKSIGCVGYTLKNPKCSSAEEIEIDEIDYNIQTESENKSFKSNSEFNYKIKEAVERILTNHLSVNKAAKIYNISKTILYQKVKDDTRYKNNISNSYEKQIKNETMCKIREHLQNGEILQSISNSLQIPISTVHWYKMKLIKYGLLPESLSKFRSSLRTNFEQRKNLERAIEACIMGMVQNRAAKKFGVSKATLSRRMKIINGS